MSGSCGNVFDACANHRSILASVDDDCSPTAVLVSADVWSIHRHQSTVGLSLIEQSLGARGAFPLMRSSRRACCGVVEVVMLVLLVVAAHVVVMNVVNSVFDFSIGRQGFSHAGRICNFSGRIGRCRVSQDAKSFWLMLFVLFLCTLGLTSSFNLSQNALLLFERKCLTASFLFSITVLQINNRNSNKH